MNTCFCSFPSCILSPKLLWSENWRCNSLSTSSSHVVWKLWKLCNISACLQDAWKNILNFSKISFYDLLSVFTSALVLKLSAHAVSPAVLSSLQPICYSQPWSCLQGAEGQCQSQERGLVCNDIFMDCGTSQHSWALQMWADVYSTFLHIFVAISLAVRLLPLLVRWYADLWANSGTSGSIDFPWLRF